jgi:hypothetical protein
MGSERNAFDGSPSPFASSLKLWADLVYLLVFLEIQGDLFFFSCSENRN